MQKVHPKIKSFIDVFYDGDVKRFIKEYKQIVGSEINFSNPSAGIILFIRKKWGLSSDLLLGLEDIEKSIKHKKFKNLKKKSNIYAYASIIKQFLSILINEKLLNANEIDFRTRIQDPKEDADRFIDFYGLNKNSINTFSQIMKILEERDIYIFAFPVNTDKQEGIIYPSSPSFIILNSNIKKAKAGFALAHEIGHFLYKDIEDDKQEEFLSDKFATYLVIPSSILPYIEEIFKRALSMQNKEFIFIKEICKTFSCNIHPLTAIERLSLAGRLSREEKKEWKEQIIKIERNINKRKSKANWEKKLSEKLGVMISEKYKKALGNLLSQRQINKERYLEMIFEKVAYV